MTLYVIKPPVYDAMQWTGDNTQAIIDFVGINSDMVSRFRPASGEEPAAVWYDSQGGWWQTLVVSNWVVLDPYGNYQPYDETNFAALFQLA